MFSARVTGDTDLSEAGMVQMIRPESPDPGASSGLCLQTRLGDLGGARGAGLEHKGPFRLGHVLLWMPRSINHIYSQL